jgi:uncharacterized membrane protein
MSTRRWILVAAIAMVVLGLLAAGVATGVSCSRGCDPAPIPVEVDAGPINEEADRLLEEAARDAERKREIVERRHQEAIEEMDEEERRELERVRDLPAEDLERWLIRFDSELRSSPSS